MQAPGARAHTHAHHIQLIITVATKQDGSEKKISSISRSSLALSPLQKDAAAEGAEQDVRHAQAAI